MAMSPITKKYWKQPKPHWASKDAGFVSKEQDHAYCHSQVHSNTFGGTPRDPSRGELAGALHYLESPTDGYETEEAYVVRVEIAGMREEDFDVAVENHTLHISGNRPDQLERRAYHQMEIRFGKFATAVSLPGPVNVEQSHAEYQDGFLTVVLPKAKTNQIKVE